VRPDVACPTRHQHASALAGPCHPRGGRSPCSRCRLPTWQRVCNPLVQSSVPQRTLKGVTAMARFAHAVLSAALLASAVAAAGAWSVSSPAATLPPCRRLRAGSALRTSPSPRAAARPLGALRASFSSPSEAAALADRLMGLQLPMEVRLWRSGLCARAASAASAGARGQAPAAWQRVLGADVQHAD